MVKKCKLTVFFYLITIFQEVFMFFKKKAGKDLDVLDDIEDGAEAVPAGFKPVPEETDDGLDGYDDLDGDSPETYHGE